MWRIPDSAWVSAILRIVSLVNFACNRIHCDITYVPAWTAARDRSRASVRMYVSNVVELPERAIGIIPTIASSCMQRGASLYAVTRRALRIVWGEFVSLAYRTYPLFFSPRDIQLIPNLLAHATRFSLRCVYTIIGRCLRTHVSIHLWKC